MFAFLFGLMLGGGIGYCLCGIIEEHKNRNTLTVDYPSYKMGYDVGYRDGYAACEKDIDEGVIDEY